jgi:hypothetical protein
MPAPEESPMDRQAEQTGQSPSAEAVAGPLVPIEGGPPILPGIQAFRRGDIVLYTVRGEPSEVQELMGRLDKEQVGEVIALISHHAQDEPPPAQETEE